MLPIRQPGAGELELHAPLQDKDKKPLRKGIKLEDLSEGQKAAALNLLKAGLSEKAYGQATTIMSLENLLKELEGNGANVRNPNWYFVSIFGEPSNEGKWGWRVEGHHLSVNLTLDKGVVVSATPVLTRGEPGRGEGRGAEGLRTLPEIEDLAKELIKSLGRGTVTKVAPAKEAKQFEEVQAEAAGGGVRSCRPRSRAKMTDAQKAMLWKLMEAYANGRMPGEAAEDEPKKASQDAGLDEESTSAGLHREEDKAGQSRTPTACRGRRS